MRMRATRHNGRAGKNGVYNPKHNDRDFDVENSDHIDEERTGKNIYWDYLQGAFTDEERWGKDGLTFSEVERHFYIENYWDYVEAQNERNEKARHPERNAIWDCVLIGIKKILLF